MRCCRPGWQEGITQACASPRCLPRGDIGVPTRAPGDPGLIDKISPDMSSAMAGISDGATVMISGFGSAGMPSALIDALIAQGAGDLTIVNNNAGNG